MYYERMLREARSVLYVPAHRPEMIAKIQSLTADFFVVDLEDGVAPSAKAAARDNVREAVAKGQLPKDRWGLRANNTDSKWFEDDLKLVREIVPPVVVVPKAEDPGAIASLAERQSSPIALMIETALGVGHARALASAHRSVCALCCGSADLQRSLRARPGGDRTWERHAMSEILLAARMSDCAAIDAVTFEFRNADKLESDARVARELGFDGKSCIHPAQVETIHKVFSSTAEEVEWAEGVLDAWKEQDGDRAGVVVIDNEMIEALHLDIARRILSRKP